MSSPPLDIRPISDPRIEHAVPIVHQLYDPLYWTGEIGSGIWADAASPPGMNAESRKVWVAHVETAMRPDERQDTLSVPFETHLVVAVS